jgi:hypothetical protein
MRNETSFLEQLKSRQFRLGSLGRRCLKTSSRQREELFELLQEDKSKYTALRVHANLAPKWESCRCTWLSPDVMRRARNPLEKQINGWDLDREPCQLLFLALCCAMSCLEAMVNLSREVAERMLVNSTSRAQSNGLEAATQILFNRHFPRICSI